MAAPVERTRARPIRRAGSIDDVALVWCIDGDRARSTRCSRYTIERYGRGRDQQWEAFALQGCRYETLGTFHHLSRAKHRAFQHRYTIALQERRALSSYWDTRWI